MASESNNGASFYSDHEIVSTLNKDFQKYATLENNIWSLDGSLDILPDKAPYGDTGYVAESSNPMVTITFSSVLTQLVAWRYNRLGETYNEYALVVGLQR